MTHTTSPASSHASPDAHPKPTDASTDSKDINRAVRCQRHSSPQNMNRPKDTKVKEKA